jgi:hypothetical protein
MNSARWTAGFVVALGLGGPHVAVAAPSARFDVKLAVAARTHPVDGRLLVVVSRKMEGEPRTHLSWGKDTQQVFAVDVEGLQAGQVARIDAAAEGHPLSSLRDLPAGTYNVQAVLHLYETFPRADGHVLKLPMDDGEGQDWKRSPGNLFSKPRTVAFDSRGVVALDLTEVIPPIPVPADTKYVRSVTVQSALLTRFWGRPMSLRAIVLVPEGFDETPQQRYPVAFQQGHFPSGFRSFRETPPDPGAEGEARRRQDDGYRFFQEWSSGRLPKMLVVLTQHPTPYYDDSYGVNSANMGPYGDALTQELYPEVERRFRAIGEPWARVLYGGSTGGWMTLAQQVFYPDYFGGAWGFCPDPVDFHSFQLLDLYEEKNAYFDIGPFGRVPKPLGRLRDGRLISTMESFDRQEHVLGTHGRSGGQLDAFHAVFGPVGPDGYPARLWKADTGEVDPEVARHWRERYDLTALLRRDWATLGPRLVGKLHVTMGTKDTFYLDGAARLLEEFLESTKRPGKGPYWGGTFEYGDNEPHCYVGKIPPGQTLEMHYLPLFARHMRAMAPEGADVKGWMAAR